METIKMDEEKTNHHPQFIFDKFYHIYNRAVENNLLFYSNDNYSFFLKKYKFYLKDIVRTYAFCLLPNHFHMLVSPIISEPLTVSKQFQRFFISYSMSLNKQRIRRGNLFQKNFKRKLISDIDYLKNVICYIHYNPSHHFVDTDYMNYEYSSFRMLIDNRPTDLERNEVLSWFGGVDKFIQYHKNSKYDSWNDIYGMEE